MSNSFAMAADIGAVADENGDVDLDALLADSIQHHQDTKFLNRDKARLEQQARKEQKKKEYALANQYSKQYAAPREWQPVAAVAFFHTQRCVACGTNHTHFMGIFQRQIKTNSGITGTVSMEQWVRATDHTMIEGLPKEQKENDEPVDMCICCAKQLGYPPKLFA